MQTDGVYANYFSINFLSLMVFIFNLKNECVVDLKN